jgi:hypothetical protein
VLRGEEGDLAVVVAPGAKVVRSTGKYHIPGRLLQKYSHIRSPLACLTLIHLFYVNLSGIM